MPNRFRAITARPGLVRFRPVLSNVAPAVATRLAAQSSGRRRFVVVVFMVVNSDALATSMDGVRRRPGMYFGNTGPSGLQSLALEVVANALDQVVLGHADRITVAFPAGNEVIVSDNGAGFPVRPNPDGTSFLTDMFTVVRLTPTADGHRPHVHLSMGVGLGPVSAVCDRVEVESRRPDALYRQAFSRGCAVTPLEKVAQAPPTTGTTVRLVPDAEIFSESIPRESLTDGLRILALITPGLTVDVDGEQFGPVGDLRAACDLRVRKWRYHPYLHDAPFTLGLSRGHVSALVALAWIDSGLPPDIQAFCNFRPMVEGGTMVQGVEEGLRAVFGSAPMDRLMSGLVGVVHVTLLDPDIQGPTRGRLESPEAIWLVADAIASGLPEQLAGAPEVEVRLRARVPLRPTSE